MVRRERGRIEPEKAAVDLGDDAPKAAEITPTEIEAKAPAVVVQPKPPPIPSQAPVHEPPPTRVKLEVWCQLSGIKWDKLAGFKYLARKAKLGPLTVPEWRAEWAKYRTRPVG